MAQPKKKKKKKDFGTRGCAGQYWMVEGVNIQGHTQVLRKTESNHTQHDTELGISSHYKGLGYYKKKKKKRLFAAQIVIPNSSPAE